MNLQRTLRWTLSATLLAAAACGAAPSGDATDDLHSGLSVQVTGAVSPAQASAGDTVTASLTLTSKTTTVLDVSLSVLAPDGSVGYSAAFPSTAVQAGAALTLQEPITVDATDPQGTYTIAVDLTRTGAGKPFFSNHALATFTVGSSNACVPLSDAALCSAAGFNCGAATLTDNCTKMSRSVNSCGTCSGTCTSNVCFAPVSGTVTLAWSTPAANAALKGSTTFTLTGTSLVNVELFQNGTLLVRANVAPSRTSATATVDTTKLADGALTLTAHAWNTPPGDGSFTSDADAGSRAFTVSNGTSTGGGGGTTTTGGLSYMVGIKTNSVPNGPATLASWLKRPVDVAGTTITTTSWIGVNQSYSTSNGEMPLLEVSFPLLSIYGESNNLSDLGQAASGAYDATYTAMAQELASWPNPLLSARINWEFNGSWYKWSNGAATNSTYANYVASFRRAAAIIKKYNPHVLIQWNIAWGQPDPTPYWPGAYDPVSNPGGVDVISMDFYQANISQYNNGGNTSTWAMAQSGGGTINLDWMVSFAKANNVKIALSEYGAGNSSSNGETSGHGLDDGTWTTGAINWINSQPAGFFLFTDWSDDGPADDIVTAGANPNEQAAWSAAWSGTHYAGTWWTGTAPPH